MNVFDLTRDETRLEVQVVDQLVDLMGLEVIVFTLLHTPVNHSHLVA